MQSQPLQTSVSKTRTLVCAGLLAAIGVLLTMLIHFPILPAVPFMEVDFGDMPAMIAAFAFSPLVGVATITVTAIVQALTVSAASGWIGALMHIIASGTFILCSSLIYHRFRNFKGALIGVVVGIAAATAMMVPLNILMTPIFMNVDREIVLNMIVPAIIPFNAIKFTMNAVLVLALYQPLRAVIRIKRG